MPSKLTINHLLDFWWYPLIRFMHQLNYSDGFIHIFTWVGNESKRFPIGTGSSSPIIKFLSYWIIKNNPVFKVSLKAKKMKKRRTFSFSHSKLCLQSGNLVFLLGFFCMNPSQQGWKHSILKSLNAKQNNYDSMRLPKIRSLKRNF